MSGGPDVTTYTVPVPEDKAGSRLDRFLADALPELSRARVQALIAGGQVAGPGAATANTRIRAGAVYTVTVPPSIPAVPQKQQIPLVIVYEDEHLVVVDKPAGLVVHPAAGSPDGTLVNALLAHCEGSLSGIGGVMRPGIVHRLDKDTSGLIVIAKTDAAHPGLAEQFAAHTLARAYRALVWGVPNPREGEVSGNIGRDPHDRKRMAIVSTGGKPALTRYRVLRVVGTRASLVECRLATGRTHQIRVHMAAIGHAVVGDPVYGERANRRNLRELPAAGGIPARQALHARLLGFRHPVTGAWMEFEADTPTDFGATLKILETV